MKFNKAYWNKRYETQDIGWDVGTITTPLKAYIDQIENKTLKILIPGAGNAYELEYLHQQGFSNVYVVDIAENAIESSKQRIKNVPANHFLLNDFFDLKNSFDLIIEQTFFCALDPVLRENYVQKTHELLTEKGKAIGLLFDFPLTEIGPPFGGDKEDYLKLFSPLFKIKTLETAYNSIKPRKDKELFFIFEKK
ncbi:SAM-dependent methyltransferase [Flavobacterium orientale]|uniref:SAM-dependent methyltransferase n=2 Tax=Flavobacterium orientale TaxID=1756020 RepID=A0A916Y3M5_9FLAO|nr:SAM-dependent methyltransferase [Flavobacterium orientale]